MNIDNNSSVAPRPIPPPSELNRWDLADILNPTSGGAHFNRDRKMSLDFPPSQQQHSLYSPPDIDQSFSMHNNENGVSSSPSHNQLGPSLQPQGFDHSEGMGTPEHPSYDLFSGSASGGSFASRYRQNASSSSSLGHGYSLNSEGIYSHTSFNDSIPSFNGSTPYDMISSLPSSYSSGKVSPLTPNDSVGSLHHTSGFPPSKDYPPQNFSDMPDRRLPNINGNGYHEFAEEYSINNINGGLSFPPSGMPQYQDRLGRFASENRYNHASGPPSSVGHINSGHNSDIMRGVAPHATHSFRENGVPGYEDMPHYLGANPHTDLSLRMPSVDETLARMKLQGHPPMGSANDLQTFIR